MKPKDLKCPFKWEERRPHLEERVLFIPPYYFAHDAFVMPPLSEVFASSAPIFLEYCSGNGDWVIDQAEKAPHHNWIAVEKRFDRVRKIWSKRENKKLKNLFIVAGEGFTFSKYYLPDTSLDGVYINFPDPWPKDKHAKHRLFQEPFICELARTLKGDKKITFVSDFPLCVEQAAAVIGSNPLFINKTLEHDHPEYGVSSYFHHLWKTQGKQISFLSFTRSCL